MNRSLHAEHGIICRLPGERFGYFDWPTVARLEDGNLSAFKPDGSASCAYLYPDAVNGNPGRCWDPLANDQDWALVFLLQAAAIDPDFEKERWS